MSISKSFITVGFILFVSIPAFSKKASTTAADDCAKPSELAVGSTCWISPSSLHPTQFAVGFREVDEKKKKLESKDADAKQKYLAKHVIPVVRGPGDVLYLTDGHHLATAASRAGLDSVVIEVKNDFSKLSPEEFWKEMKTRGLVHLFSENGEPRTPEQIPAHLLDLKNDIFRDLAASVRDEGNLETDQQPFAEFRWANFLRGKIGKGLVESNYREATQEGIALISEELRMSGKPQNVTAEQQRLILDTIKRLGPQAPCSCLGAGTSNN